MSGHLSRSSASICKWVTVSRLPVANRPSRRPGEIDRGVRGSSRTAKIPVHTMFIGHYGVAFAVKRVERRIPLWILFVAVQFVDVIWAVLVFFGVEKARITRGSRGS